MNPTIIGSGEVTLVLAHGYGGTQEVWDMVIPQLSKQYRVLLFDWIFSGAVDSTNFDTSKYSSLSALSDDLIVLLDDKKMKGVVFVGHSMAAMIGCITSIKRPELFSHLILIGASPRDLRFKFREFVSSSGGHPPLQRFIKWFVPPSGSVKLNVDVACRPPTSAFAVVVRDSHGNFVEAFSGRFSCSFVPIAEGTAVRMALMLLHSRVFTGAIVESDSLEIVTLLFSDSRTWPWHLCDCLTGITDLFLRDTSAGVSIIYSPRTSNMVAHILVAKAFSGPTFSSFPFPPDFLLNYLKSDC